MSSSTNSKADQDDCITVAVSSNDACVSSSNQDDHNAPELQFLNNDTLDLFFRYIEKNMDVLSVMHTCRRLFRIGLPILLRRKISLATFPALRSFHEFLVSAHPVSAAAVRNLMINIKNPQNPEILEIVSKILKRAQYLHTLCINTDDIYWDATAQTVSSMTDLRRLELTGDPFSDEAQRMLRLLRCSLSCIRLSRLDAIMRHLLDRDSVSRYVNPTPILEQFQDSLEEVGLSMMVLEFPSIPFSCPKVACVKMDTFSLTPLSTLVSLFPNARILIMEDLRVSLGAENDAQKQSRRDNNISFQHEQQRWQSLLAVEATWGSLYTTALRSEVTSLHITTDIDDWRNVSSLILEDLFHHLCPQHLRLSSYFIPSSFADLLKGGLSRLQRLDLSLHLSVEPRPGLSEVLAGSLKGVPIRMLDCHLDFWSESCSWAIQYATQSGMSGFVRAAVAAVPSLEYIKVSVRRSSHDLPTKTTYWQVSIADGQNLLQQVREDDYPTMYKLDRMFIPPEACAFLRDFR